MDRRHINIEVGGKKDKSAESVSFTLSPQGYGNLVTKDDLIRHTEKIKRYVDEEIRKISPCACKR